MIIDRQNLVSQAQAVTASAVSTDTIDLSQARDLGPGEIIYFFINTDVTATAAGAATVTFQIISASNAALSAGVTVLASTDAIGKAELTAGRRPIVLALNRSILAAQPIGQRYLGIQYTVGTGPLTAGSFTAGVVLNPQDVGKNYPNGFAII